MRRMSAVLFIVFALSSEALAQLSIDEARLDEKGFLIVRGTAAKRGQLVTLDRKFTTRSGAGGIYRFRVRHMPFVCRIEVRAGGVQEVSKVDNCVMDDMRRAAEPVPAR